LTDQLLSIAIELDRRAALKRARDRRYRAKRIATRRAESAFLEFRWPEEAA